MIQASGVLIKNDRKLAPFSANAFYSLGRAFFAELHALHLDQREEKFSVFGLFLNNKI